MVAVTDERKPNPIVYARPKMAPRTLGRMIYNAHVRNPDAETIEIVIVPDDPELPQERKTP